MKYLTVIVPAYNAEKSIVRCLDSIVPLLDNIDVILVDNGSEDDTFNLMSSYKERFPNDFKLLSKEHGGPGSAINWALGEVETPWLRALDSDDYMLEKGLRALLNLLSTLQEENPKPEMIVTDYYYEINPTSIRDLSDKVETSEDYVDAGTDNSGVPERVLSDYLNIFTEPGISSWSRMKNFDIEQLLGKQSITYHIDLIEKINFRLPDHCLYVDQLYAYEPLPHVRRIYYLNEPVYVYSVGDSKQSCNMNVVRQNHKDLIAIALEMFRRVRLDSVRPQRLQRYMYHHLSKLIAVSLMPLSLEGSGKTEALDNMSLLWTEFAKINPVAARKLRNTPRLHPRRILKAASTYTNQNVYNLLGKVFILE